MTLVNVPALSWTLQCLLMQCHGSQLAALEFLLIGFALDIWDHIVIIIIINKKSPKTLGWRTWRPDLSFLLLYK